MEKKYVVYVTVDSNDGDYVRDYEKFDTLEDAVAFKNFADEFASYALDQREFNDYWDSVNDVLDKFLEENPKYKKYEYYSFPTDANGYGHTIDDVTIYQEV